MSRKPTIYEIAELTKESSPYFFSKKTLRCFGQTMSKFKVYKADHLNEPDKFLISCPVRSGGKIVSHTYRLFNPLTNKLESLPK